MFTGTQAALLASGMALAQGMALAATQDSKSTPTPTTTSITSDSPAAKALREPAVKTADEAARAQPLDWRKNLGTPRQVEPTPEQAKAQADAKPGSVEGGPAQGDDDMSLRDAATEQVKPREPR